MAIVKFSACAGTDNGVVVLGVAVLRELPKRLEMQISVYPW
jgi:hypothetical protein